ncbi:fimbrial biogenesis chaperone [Taibaiella koreensis]|uniref:fimbrial biogenesis chaperone n=1 Tax=Taibaiella koreensis TaxID=1268548 RepID=UPI000E59D334|nr:molecular chaperone [Taibaiella koreensis]
MRNLLFKIIPAVLLLWFAAVDTYAQAGITASPTRLYFKPGSRQEQKVMVTNPNKDKALEIGVSLNDWNYDSLGNNMSYDAGTLSISCAGNVKVLPGSYFTLAPGESKELSISVGGIVAGKSIPVRTAMLYLTQLNPGDGTAQNGAAIKVTVRMGIKIYYTELADAKADMEITNFTTRKNGDKIEALKLYVDNTGTAWLNGTIHYDLLNKETGKKYQIPAQEFYSLPGDKRLFENALPQEIDKGRYTATAIVNFGANEELKLAELDFNY